MSIHRRIGNRVFACALTALSLAGVAAHAQRPAPCCSTHADTTSHRAPDDTTHVVRLRCCTVRIGEFGPLDNPAFLVVDSADHVLGLIGPHGRSLEAARIDPSTIRSIAVNRPTRPISNLGPDFAGGIIVIELNGAGSAAWPSGAQHASGGVATSERFDTPEAAVAAMYAAISGPAGAQRDWPRFRRAFDANAELTRVARTSDGAWIHTTESVGDFVQRTDSTMRASGHVERELRHTTTLFGAMAHILSSYETQSGTAATRRGLNSIELYQDESGWHIQSLLWDIEREGSKWPLGVSP